MYRTVNTEDRLGSLSIPDDNRHEVMWSAAGLALQYQSTLYVKMLVLVQSRQAQYA